MLLRDLYGRAPIHPHRCPGQELEVVANAVFAAAQLKVNIAVDGVDEVIHAGGERNPEKLQCAGGKVCAAVNAPLFSAVKVGLGQNRAVPRTEQAVALVKLREAGVAVAGARKKLHEGGIGCSAVHDQLAFNIVQVIFVHRVGIRDGLDCLVRAAPMADDIEVADRRAVVCGDRAAAADIAEAFQRAVHDNRALQPELTVAAGDVLLHVRIDRATRHRIDHQGAVHGQCDSLRHGQQAVAVGVRTDTGVPRRVRSVPIEADDTAVAVVAVNVADIAFDTGDQQRHALGNGQVLRKGNVRLHADRVAALCLPQRLRQRRSACGTDACASFGFLRKGSRRQQSRRRHKPQKCCQYPKYPMLHIISSLSCRQ